MLPASRYKGLLSPGHDLAKSSASPVPRLVLPQGKSKEGKVSQEQMALFAGAAALRTFLEPEEKEEKEKKGAAGPGASILLQAQGPASAQPCLWVSLISNISPALLAVQLTN